ncbi:DUF3558 domain-containing protein [Nocardia sp. NBC_01329]|uniref:DUF3558 domain-containing protein n=1 Tax=Nocardia sp. NBC_01329 TaxID=2903594 RepID=UPI002E0EF649|nr:DUF3558 domain-containing protein [Nocardia sp. NBC_01329]
MRMKSAMIAGGMALTMLMGCSSSDSDDSDFSKKAPPKVAALGPFVGECGHVTDQEVSEVLGGPVWMSYKNSTGCRWEGSGSMTFASYRGSPIGRERAWVTTAGRAPESIEVAGRPGFQGSWGTICDLAVQLDDDFFEWSHQAGTLEPPCEAARELAELTVQRLQ